MRFLVEELEFLPVILILVIAAARCLVPPVFSALVQKAAKQ